MIHFLFGGNYMIGRNEIRELSLRGYSNLVDGLTHVIDKIDKSFKDIQKPKVALYIRVSTEEQAKHGYSLEVQEKELKEFCKIKGWEITRSYIDKGKTATTTQGRDGYDMMLKHAEEGQFNIILFKWWSRLFRNQAQLAMMLPRFKKEGIFPYAMAESNDRISVKLKGVLDEEEIERVKERVEGVMVDRVKAGKLVCRPAFGYSIRYKTRNKTRVGFLEPNDDAKKVKQIFEYVSCLIKIDYTAVAKHFGLSRRVIMNMLSNRLYIGYVKYKGEWFKGEHKAIMELSLFFKVDGLLGK